MTCQDGLFLVDAHWNQYRHASGSNSYS
jgi:hypothetical protein